MLGSVVERRVDAALAGELERASISSISYPRVMVLSGDCDLLWDWKARSESTSRDEEADRLKATMPHVLVAILYEESEVRERVAGGQMWKRLRQNQDARYHYFPEAFVGPNDDNSTPELIIDFKKVLGLSTEKLYEGLEAGIERQGLVPQLYAQDLAQRFHAFHSRVALPDELPADTTSA